MGEAIKPQGMQAAHNINSSFPTRISLEFKHISDQYEGRIIGNQLSHFLSLNTCFQSFVIMAVKQYSRVGDDGRPPLYEMTLLV